MLTLIKSHSVEHWTGWTFRTSLWDCSRIVIRYFSIFLQDLVDTSRLFIYFICVIKHKCVILEIAWRVSLKQVFICCLSAGLQSHLSSNILTLSYIWGLVDILSKDTTNNAFYLIHVFLQRSREDVWRGNGDHRAGSTCLHREHFYVCHQPWTYHACCPPHVVRII